MSGELTTFAALQQRRFDTSTSPIQRKERGHFGTPPAIAEFMARMFSEIPSGTVRVLDPGAGVGTLSAAICERALQQKSPRHLIFELWETDAKLIPLLQRTMCQCRKTLQDKGHFMEFDIRAEDFVLAGARKSLFDNGPDASFHLAILNPPYFKLRKDSAHARAMEHVVHGQPNIYALFLAVAADLLLPGGEMVAITPRSYFNGPYFKRFRKWFFDRLTARQIHVFESRTAAFKNDEVLQENVILHAQKAGKPATIRLTKNQGRDFAGLQEESSPYDKIIDTSNGDHIVRVSTNRFDHEIIETMDNLPNRFQNLGFEISTGPVVTFRATEFLRHERGEDTAPLFWMHNVRPFIVQFPPKISKPTHIEASEASQKLLVPAKTYVLLKRFTSKEEKRRLVAGIIKAGDCYSQWVGLENHLNYVYRRQAELSTKEAFGLAAFFNSALVDSYFRAISGNTQVNATEIRGMPMPNAETLVRIGEEVERVEVRDASSVERLVGCALCLPRDLIGQLIEVAQ